MGWDRPISNEDILDALRRANSKLPEGAALAARLGVAGTNYEELKDDDDPSSPTILDRFGGWLPALAEAGIAGNAAQYKRGMHLQFSDEDLIAAVTDLMRKQPGWHLPFRTYDEQREPGQPSGALIRKRLHESVGTWTDIQIAARSYLIAERQNGDGS